MEIFLNKSAVWRPWLLAACLVAAPAVAAPASPSPAQERVITAYTKAFNSGRIPVMQAFVRENVSLAGRPPDPVVAESYNKQFSSWGRLSPALNAAGFDRAMKSEALDEWLRFSFAFAPNDPEKLAGVAIDPIPPPGEPPPIDEAEALSRVETMAERLASKDFFSGVVWVAKGDRTLLSRAFGLADRVRGLPNRTDTAFNLASANKMFTAVAAARLEELGKLSFSDAVSKILPAYPKAAGDKITVRHLLTHTSGLEDIGGQRFLQERGRLKTSQDFIDFYGADPLQFEPGARWQYSNLGYIVLGRIIEAACGKDFDACVKELVLDPAGMRATGSFPLEEPSPSRAVGYTDVAPDKQGRPGRVSPGRRFDASRYFFLRGTPAGYMFSTAPDLLRFSRALSEGKILSPAQLAHVTAGHAPMGGAGDSYGYGFIEGHVDGVRWYGHGGGGPGVNTFFAVLPDREYTVIVLANADAPSADWIGRRTLGALAHLRSERSR